jgi:hypothetical protein
VGGRKKEPRLFLYRKGIHVRSDHQGRPWPPCAEKAHDAVPGDPGAHFQSSLLKMIRHCGGCLLLRVSWLRDLMKLSTDPDNLLFALLDEFLQIDHILTSKKKSVEIRQFPGGLSHTSASPCNGMFSRRKTPWGRFKLDAGKQLKYKSEI